MYQTFRIKAEDGEAITNIRDYWRSLDDIRSGRVISIHTDDGLTEHEFGEVLEALFHGKSHSRGYIVSGHEYIEKNE